MGNTSACMRQRGSSVEQQIEQSKSHWSVLAEAGADGEGHQVAEVSNVQVFRDLQRHPSWGDFFQRWDEFASMKVGKKFAEGAQAELFHCNVKWPNPKANEEDLKEGVEWVLKVFKKGTFLHNLQSQLPQGLLQFHAAHLKYSKSPTSKKKPCYRCQVFRGILLKDGRFAFLMQKEDFDLRTLIEFNMKSKHGEHGRPFLKEDVELMMYNVALGVEWLHNHNIVHRDMKASNILVTESQISDLKWHCFIADYECSIGVVGTGFFRAPEILQACKDRKLYERPEVFSKAADIYSYGMICYEILTGKFPFQGHYGNDYDLVFNGERPIIPRYIESWICDLLVRCWQYNPIDRPIIGEIVDILVAKSRAVQEYDELLKSVFGEYHRYKYEFKDVSL